MKRLPRRQIMIDQEVQGALITRAVWYWLGCEAVVLLMHVLWRLSSEAAEDPWRTISGAALDLLPALLGTLLLLPLVIADVLRLSNRFVGPIWNLRNAIKRIELGDAVPPLQRRPSDFWPELLQQVNPLLRQKQEPCERAACSAADAGPDSAATAGESNT